jgi:hypothetical protein
MRLSFRLSERHGKFAREVGSIVLGVLIALALGEIAAGIRWRVDAASARAAIVTDFQRDAGVMHERRLARRCIERRLRDIDALIARTQRSGLLPAVSGIGRPPTRPLVTAAWDMSVSSGVLPHLAPADANEFSTNFDMIKELAGDMKRQSVLWAKLSALEHRPGPVPQEFVAEIMLTLGEFRQSSAYVDMVAGQLVEAGRGRGKLDYWMILDRHGGSANDVVAALRAKPICAPLLVDGKPSRT